MLIRATPPPDEPDVLTRVTAEQAGWQFLNAEVRALKRSATWAADTGDCEAVLVLLGGQCSITGNRGQWAEVGRRPDVFSGMPHALYLPRGSAFTVSATTDRTEIAYCWVPTDEDHPARLVTPADSAVEIRGGNNATRQINSIVPPGFDCHRIVCVEVYTPGGNWSSYPPHKHDVHRLDDAGNVAEADLEEIYYFKVNKPQGYAIQRVYNDDRSIDAAMVAHNDDIVLVPEGYHPVSAPWGYDCYYLNFLAGSAQSLAATDDPDHAWIKQTWTQRDPRVPMVTLDMEEPATT
ncbi:MAG: 5-deoxy-glucuronate isomerase [Phycisphaerae bacterium]|nr:5-deoxy-glucuronate isomerase [Phycisphaerae bacterium]